MWEHFGFKMNERGESSNMNEASMLTLFNNSGDDKVAKNWTGSIFPVQEWMIYIYLLYIPMPNVHYLNPIFVNRARESIFYFGSEV